MSGNGNGPIHPLLSSYEFHEELFFTTLNKGIWPHKLFEFHAGVKKFICYFWKIGTFYPSQILYSRLQDKHRGTLINFWVFFQGQPPY